MNSLYMIIELILAILRQLIVFAGFTTVISLLANKAETFLAEKYPVDAAASCKPGE